MIQKARKKPVVIEYMKYEGNNSPEILFWMGHYHVQGAPRHGSIAENGRFIINTLEGNMEVSKGDLVIKGVSNEFYPCKPDIFAKTYEPDIFAKTYEPAAQPIEIWDREAIKRFGNSNATKRLVFLRGCQFGATNNYEFNRGAQSGWFRALVCYLDMDAEGKEEYIIAANERWPLNAQQPAPTSEIEKAFKVMKRPGSTDQSLYEAGLKMRKEIRELKKPLREHLAAFIKIKETHKGTDEWVIDQYLASLLFPNLYK